MLQGDEVENKIHHILENMGLKAGGIVGQAMAFDVWVWLKWLRRPQRLTSYLRNTTSFEPLPSWVALPSQSHKLVDPFEQRFFMRYSGPGVWRLSLVGHPAMHARSLKGSHFRRPQRRVGRLNDELQRSLLHLRFMSLTYTFDIWLT